MKEEPNLLHSAETLLGGLDVEKTRWTEIANALRISLDNVIGDVVLSSGFIAYLGCFPTTVSFQMNKNIFFYFLVINFCFHLLFISIVRICWISG